MVQVTPFRRIKRLLPNPNGLVAVSNGSKTLLQQTPVPADAG